MSVEAIQDQLRALPADERRKVLAFMVALEDESRLGYATTLKERIDDKSPDRWLTPRNANVASAFRTTRNEGVPPSYRN